MACRTGLRPPARAGVTSFCALARDRQRRDRSREEARAAFLAEVRDGSASFDLLRHPLLPYQREGVLHLAFGERALLADEMGLGKTIQAIAACELLARRKDIGRVLVVCPASLKAEWEEQIARFTARATRTVFGPRAARLAAYREPTFFNIVIRAGARRCAGY
jgi:SNF2 family DNA or RNA helicase